MPMLTAASDLYEQRSQEWYGLPPRLRDLCEAADHLRDAHTMLDECGSVSRREGQHDDAHDLRSPEQAAYLAWQAAELAYQQCVGRLVATRNAETGEITIAEPEPMPADDAIVFSYDKPEPRDPLRTLTQRGEYLTPADFFADR